MDVAELILIVAVSAFSFWVKGITGFGGPLLAIPMLAPFIGVEESVVVITFSNVVSNVMLLWTNREGAKGHGPLLARLLIVGAATTVVGTVLLTVLNEAVLAVFLAASVFLYIALALTRPEFSLTADQGLLLAAPAGAVGGLMHGALGNSGTVFASFYHSLKLPRADFVFLLSITFLAFGLMQIGTLAQLGSFGEDRVIQATIVVAPVVLATRLGERFASRLSPKAFGRLVLALLAFAAIALLVGVLL